MAYGLLEIAAAAAEDLAPGGNSIGGGYHCRSSLCSVVGRHTDDLLDTRFEAWQDVALRLDLNEDTQSDAVDMYNSAVLTGIAHQSAHRDADCRKLPDAVVAVVGGDIAADS